MMMEQPEVLSECVQYDGKYSIIKVYGRWSNLPINPVINTNNYSSNENQIIYNYPNMYQKTGLQNWLTKSEP